MFLYFIKDIEFVIFQEVIRLKHYVFTLSLSQNFQQCDQLNNFLFEFLKYVQCWKFWYASKRNDSLYEWPKRTYVLEAFISSKQNRCFYHPLLISFLIKWDKGKWNQMCESIQLATKQKCFRGLSRTFELK